MIGTVRFIVINILEDITHIQDIIMAIFIVTIIVTLSGGMIGVLQVMTLGITQITIIQIIM